MPESGAPDENPVPHVKPECPIYFPHNIGLGAANDEELAYQAGLITADEAKLCHMMWNFAPVVAQSTDPRWGRTYEAYGSDLDAITRLSTAYAKGLIDGGVAACAKHFFGDGNVLCGCADFTGRLPSPWYGSIDQIGTDENFLECGYGLSYGEKFMPRAEPARLQ